MRAAETQERQRDRESSKGRSRIEQEMARIGLMSARKLLREFESTESRDHHDRRIGEAVEAAIAP